MGPRAGALRGRRPDARTVVVASAVALVWLGSRAVVLGLLRTRHDWATGDLAYFDQSMSALADVGLAHTLVEYPLPALAVLLVPGLLAPRLGTSDPYTDAVTLLSATADVTFLLLLARFAGPGRRAAVVVWLLAVPLLGATAYARFDLVPGILAGLALLLLAAYPRLASASAAVAASLKLWPALVLPAVAAVRSTRRRVVASALAVGGTLALGSLLLGGWDRLVSPLTWQAARGLQIESVAATPAMVAWLLSPGPYSVDYSSHNAFEVTGPGTGSLALAADLLSVALPVGLVLLWSLAFRRRDDLAPETVAWLALTAVTGFMVTSKVLSPQYLMWLLPLAAAAVATSRARSLRVWAAVLLLATAATQLVFPELYPELLGATDQAGWAVLALTVRNLLLVGLLAAAAVRAVRGVLGGAGPAQQVSGEARSSASLPAPPGRSDAPSGDGPTTPT